MTLSRQLAPALALALLSTARAETTNAPEPVGQAPQPLEAATASVAPEPEPAPEPARKEPTYGASVLGKRSREARITGSAHVVGGKALETFEHDDAQRVLKQVPGVYVREEDGFGLRPNIGLRGASSDRSAKVTLMEDGVLFGPAPYSAPAAYYFPAVTRMEKVEVFKGPASVRSGPNTVGGAINFLTRRIPTGFAAGLDLGYGTFGSAKLHGHAGYGTEQAGVLVEALRLQSDGFRVIDGGGNTGFEKHETMLKAFVGSPADAAWKKRLELKLGFSNEDSRETYLGLTDDDLRESPWRRYAATARDRMQWWRTQAQLAYTVAHGDSFDLRVVAYRHDMQRTWGRLDRFASGPDLADVLRSPTGRNGVYAAVLRALEDSDGEGQRLMLARNDRRFVSQGLQATGRWEFKTGPLAHELLFGARLHQDRIVRLHTGDAYDMRAGSLSAAGTPSETTADNTGSANTLSLHALDELEVGPWTISPGLRLEVVDNGLDDRLAKSAVSQSSATLLPGLGVSFQPVRAWTFLAGVHRGYSPVSPGQPAEVKPESSVNVEAGGRWQHRRGRAEVIGFWNRYSNLTSECTGSSGCLDQQLGLQFNAGAVDVWGLEASGGVEQAIGPVKLNLDGSYTLTRSSFLSSFDSAFPQYGRVQAGDELPYVPVHQAAASGSATWDRYTGALSATYVGVMRDRAGQGEAKASELTDAQLVIDAVASARLWAGGSLYLKATNLLDAAFIASRRPYGARAAQPRMIFVGYKHAFGG